MPRKKYRPPKVRLRNKLDGLVGDIVRWRDGYQCYCQNRVVPQAGHLVGRSNWSVRFDLTNVNVQCKNCNLEHNHPNKIYRYINWHKGFYGADEFFRIMRLAEENETQETFPISRMAELEEKLTELAKFTKQATVYDSEELWLYGFYGDTKEPPNFSRRFYTFRELRTWQDKTDKKTRSLQKRR